MIVMAEAYGADGRLVAFMQYLRVAVVAVTASIVARVWGLNPSHVVANVTWFPPISWLPLLATLALATLGPCSRTSSTSDPVRFSYLSPPVSS